MSEEIRYDPIPILEVNEARSIVEDGAFKRVTKTRQLDEALTYQSVAYLVVPPDTPEARHKEILICEVLKQPNLQWWEICELERQLHEMRQADHGKGRHGDRRKAGWTLRDTAAELEIGFGTLSENLRLAEAVMADPNLRKITDKTTAKRLIFGRANRIQAEVEAAAPIVGDEYNLTLCGDSAEILKHFADGTFDVCFTDPPWLEYKDPKLVKDAQTIKVFEQIYRVLKADAFLYAIVSSPDFAIYQAELPKFGFKVQQMPLIWHKKNVVSHGLRSWEYHRDYEPILLAVKGSPTLVPTGFISAVHSSPVVHSSRLIHANEKPVDVPMHFLEHCTYEGSMVLDPFGGSGVTAEACLRLNRRYVTIERDKTSFDRIEQRLANFLGQQNQAQLEGSDGVQELPSEDDKSNPGG